MKPSNIAQMVQDNQAGKKSSNPSKDEYFFESTQKKQMTQSF